MPHIEVPENSTPGDLFRAIADWYDQHPGLSMPAVDISEWPRAQEYVDAFAERFGVTPEVVTATRGEYDRVKLNIRPKASSTRPGAVTLTLYGPDRNATGDSEV